MAYEPVPPKQVATLAALPEAELVALRKDAERYRWLRSPANGLAVTIMCDYGMTDAAELDAAIDAAMAQTTEG